MDLSTLKRAELALLCEELGLTAKGLKRDMMEDIKALTLSDEDLAECWEDALERQKREKEAAVRAEKERERELEIKKLEIERIAKEAQLLQARQAQGSSSSSLVSDCLSVKMTKLIQPFKVGEDIGLYLVNF